MLAHHVEQLVAGLVEVDELSLAAEKRRSRAEVAPHRAAHRRNDGGGRVALALRELDAHDRACRSPRRCPDGGWARARPRPGSAASRRCLRRARCGRRRSCLRCPGMAATCPPTTMVESGESSRTIRHISRTLPTFTMIDGDADDVVMVAPSSSRRKPRASGNRAPCRARRYSAWIIMMPHERWNIRSEKLPLRARDLVVIKLHGVDGAAAEFIVLRVGSEDRTQQHTRRNTLSADFFFNFQNSPFVFRRTNRQPLVEDYSTAVVDWGAVHP